MGSPSFFTTARDAWLVEAGDVYLCGTVGGSRETRKVLEVLNLTPLHGAVLLVEDPRGDVFRAHVGGSLQIVEMS